MLKQIASGNGEKWFTQISWKITTVFLLTFLFPECSTFNPKNGQSSLIILQLTLTKDEVLLDELAEAKFQKVTIRKGESVFEFSENIGNYYYFQNVKEGQYEVYDAVHLLNRGATEFAFASTKQLTKIEVPFDSETISKTRLDLEPGSVSFMGTIHVIADFKFREDPTIKVKFSKSLEDEREALDTLYKNFPRSGWGQKAKSRLKLLNSISP